MLPRNIPLFQILEIETSSLCNRSCASCLRTAYPDRVAIKPWFKQTQLPTETIERIFQEAIGIGFHGAVCLQHCNEPLLDERIAALGNRAKHLGFDFVYACTNADFVNEEKAAELDGCFDELIVALYMNEPVRSKRQAWIETLFHKTRLNFTDGHHVATHFSTLYDVGALVAQSRDRACSEASRRLIISHQGDMLMCCDDVPGHFGLGNCRDCSVEELWFGARHQALLLALREPGGRTVHSHCLCCPR